MDLLIAVLAALVVGSFLGYAFGYVIGYVGIVVVFLRWLYRRCQQ